MAGISDHVLIRGFFRFHQHESFPEKGRRMSALIAFVRKELIQALRDPRMRFVLFGAPLVQLVIFGYVVTTDIKNIPLLIIDYDRSSESREFAAAFFASGYFIRVGGSEKQVTEAEAALKGNKARVAIVIPSGFSRNLSRNEPAAVQILLDGSDGNSANVTKAYIEGIIASYSKKRLELTLRVRSSAAGMIHAAPFVDLQFRVFYNPELRSSSFMVPGILCMILLIVTALLSGLSITREKELGTLEQILVSPLSRFEFILGKTVPFVLVGLIDVVLILVAARLLFHIPIRGSLVLLFFSSLIFLFTSLGLGLFGASVSRTQAQVMLTIFPFMMPAFLLSGLFFPIASMPVALRWIAYVNPLTYFLVIVRGILLKGAGLPALWRELAILTVFGAALLTFSALRFRKRIE
jgi:ABC-2 type transport system permease protein